MAKVFKLAPWPGTMVFTTDHDEWDRLYTKRDGPNVERYRDSMGLAWEDGGYHLIGVFDGKVGTLAHEMGHCAVNVMNHAGVKDFRHDDEQFTYLLGHLVEQTFPLLKGKQP